jgi:hypothetical protein
MVSLLWITLKGLLAHYCLTAMRNQYPTPNPTAKAKKGFLGCCLCLALASPGASSPGLLLYATRNADPEGALYILSKTNAPPSRVGSFGITGAIFDLAYDSEHDILYASGSPPGIFNNSLYTIDRGTGAAHLIGPFGLPHMYGLAYNPLDGVLYGATPTHERRPGSVLYRIDTNSGNATLVGSIGDFYPGTFLGITGLAFSPADGALYGCLSGSEYLGGIVRIDTATGEGTLLFEGQPLMDLAFDPETGTLFGIDNGVGLYPDGLYTIDLATGTTSLVGSPGLVSPQGLAFAMPPPPRLSAVLLSPSHVQITWPASYVDYDLESATSFPAMSWTLVTNELETSGGQFVVTIAADTPQRIFRLRTR